LFRHLLSFSEAVNKKSPSTRMGLGGGLHCPAPARTSLSVLASDQGVLSVLQLLLDAYDKQREETLQMSCPPPRNAGLSSTKASAGMAQMGVVHLRHDNGTLDAAHHVQANGHSARACDMTMHYERD
jgi:hypothetical protein